MKSIGDPIFLIIIGFVLFALLHDYRVVGVIVAVIGILRLLLSNGLIDKKY